MKKFAIIVAGGIGSRMQSSIPKQFMPMDGIPVLMYSVRAFFDYDRSINIVIALPRDHISIWEELCRNFNFDLEHSIVHGGKTRFHSVRNALRTIREDGLIAVHDGVRPLVSRDTISRCFNTAAEKSNAVPVMEVLESLRKHSAAGSISADRSEYMLVQTPQVFQSQLLKRAYNQEYEDAFTDDASLVERLGHLIHLVEGNPENIKITNKTDLVVAEALLRELNRY